jgi:alpha-mannosidase
VATSAEQRLQRLRSRLDELSYWFDRAWLELAEWRFEDELLPLGSPWPPRRRPKDKDAPAVMAHPAVRVPEGWPLDEVFLELELGGEGLVRLVYEEGGAESFGLDPWHRSFPVREGAFMVEAEVVPRLPYGVPNVAPALRLARLVWQEATLQALHRRLQLVASAAAALGVEEDSGAGLLQAAERALNSIRLPSDTTVYLSRLGRSPRLATLWAPPRPSWSRSRWTARRGDRRRLRQTCWTAS